MHLVAAGSLGGVKGAVGLVELVVDLALNDVSIRVRRVAAYTLGGNCYDERAVAALERLLASETDATILRGARWALAQHRRRLAEEPRPPSLSVSEMRECAET